jgi:acetate CoA/acetoacetate CoA-transferase beta subunit
MEPQIIIARRIALELRDNMLVNLGIGIPTLVANYVPKELHVYSIGKWTDRDGAVPERHGTPVLTGRSGRSGPGAAPSTARFL